MPRSSPQARLGTLVAALLPLSVAASLATCATGNQSPVGGTTAAGGATASSGGPAASSTAATGGGGGNGGAASTSSAGGAGPTSSSVAASSSGTTTSSSSGAPPQPSTIVYIEPSSSLIAYDENVVTMTSGFAIPWENFSSDPIGIGFTGNGLCVAVIRAQVTTDAGATMGELRYARWSGSWTPGFSGTLMPVQTTQPLYIVGGPALAGSSIRAHSAFLGTDMKLYYAEYFNGTWLPTDEPVTAGGTQSAGPAPPAIATLADTPIIAFNGAGNDLYDQTRASGTWQPANPHGVAPTAGITPSLIALTQGAELLLVWASATANDLMYTIRTAGTWSTPAAITGASSPYPVSLAPIAAGGAVLSYEGADTHLYTTVLSAGAPFTWTAPVVGVMGADPTLVGPPSVATGAKGAQAELFYLESPSYLAYSARLTSGAWGAPLMAGSASYQIAIATGD